MNKEPNKELNKEQNKTPNDGEARVLSDEEMEGIVGGVGWPHTLKPNDQLLQG